MRKILVVLFLSFVLYAGVPVAPTSACGPTPAACYQVVSRKVSNFTKSFAPLKSGASKPLQSLYNGAYRSIVRPNMAQQSQQTRYSISGKRTN